MVIEDKKKLITIIPDIEYNIDIENSSRYRYRIELPIFLPITPFYIIYYMSVDSVFLPRSKVKVLEYAIIINLIFK